MTSSKTGFLARRTYAPGEFERQQVLWNAQVGALSGQFLRPVGERLRRDIADPIAEEWTERARATLDACLAASPTAAGALDAGAMDEAQAQLRASLAEQLRKTEPVSEEALQDEIAATCRELAQVVLAQWFDRLGRARTTAADGVALNAMMLPEALNMSDLMAKVDFAMYGAALPEAVAGVTAYQKQLHRQCLERREPIAFGTRLLVAPAPGDPLQPFRLFDSEAPARRLAQAAAQGPQPSLRSLLHAVEEFYAVAAEALHFRDEHAYAPAVTGRLIEAYRASPRFECTAPAAALQAPDASVRDPRDTDPFAWLVSLGVDAMASGMAIGPDAAQANLSRQATLIDRQITRSAGELRVSSAALHTVYVYAVAAATEARLGGRTAFDSAEIPASAGSRLVTEQHLSQAAAARLASAFAAGLAFELRGFETK